MENFDLTFDVKTFTFTHEPTGFILNAEDLMMLKNNLIIDIIEYGTGVVVDDFYLEVLRDTTNTLEPAFPWK